MTLLLFIFYLTFLSYSLGFPNVLFADDSEMKQHKYLDKYYTCGDRILSNAETFRDCLPGLWDKVFQKMF